MSAAIIAAVAALAGVALNEYLTSRRLYRRQRLQRLTELYGSVLTYSNRLHRDAPTYWNVTRQKTNAVEEQRRDIIVRFDNTQDALQELLAAIAIPGPGHPASLVASAARIAGYVEQMYEPIFPREAFVLASEGVWREATGFTQIANEELRAMEVGSLAYWLPVVRERLGIVWAVIRRPR